jgi:VWFA-related protein
MLASIALRSCVFRIRILAAAAVFVGTVAAQIDAAPAPAPAGPDPQKTQAPGLVFHQSVRRVIVDVVVSDANGKPVPGLAAGDFSISEDGSPQPIRSFDVHNFDSLSDSLPKLPASLPTNTFVNVPTGPERGPLYVLLLDLLNMSVADQPVAREALLKFVRHKPLGTRFAIFVLSDGLYLVQGFTEDRNRLAEVLDPKHSRSHLPRVFLYAEKYQPYFSMPRALIKIAAFLADFPGHKNVIWISASFPTALLPSSDPRAEALTSSDEIREATDTMARGQIAVYPVDVRGTVVTHISARPMGGKMVTHTDSPQVNADFMTEEEIAQATGGRAFYNTNDLAAALTEATETGGHYYTLTYAPSNQTYNGRVRRIHIDVAKHGYQLAYRRSYYGNPSYDSPSSGNPRSGNSGSGPPSATEPESARAIRLASEPEPLPTARLASSMSPYLQHGAPLAHQLLFRAHIHTVAPPAMATPAQMEKLTAPESRQNRPAKPVRPILLQTYEIDYSIAARYPALEVAAAAFDADGNTVNALVQRAAENTAKVLAAARHEDIYHFRQLFDVPTTAVSVRLAVRDMATDNVGALEINLPLAREAPTTDAALHSAGSASDTADSSAPH